MTLGASDLSLGTRTGAGGTATLAYSFFGRSPWLHGQRVYSIVIYNLINAVLHNHQLFAIQSDRANKCINRSLEMNIQNLTKTLNAFLKRFFKTEDKLFHYNL